MTGTAGARWQKRGPIACTPHGLEWAVSHAALPVVDLDGSGRGTAYFSVRDSDGRAQIAAGDLDVGSGRPTIAMHSCPAVTFGPLGSFDESGVTSSCVVVDGERRFQYYTGWTRGVTVPFYFYIGLAVSDDAGRTYRRVSRAPVLERCDVDPYLTASPWVLIENGVWRMWYVSGVKWEMEQGRPKHYYHLKYAESSDGVRWRRRGVVSIDFASPDEYAIARPCVLKDAAAGVYRMWYAYRGARYVIGYAESSDGIRWERRDSEAGIEPSADGWDSEMIEYPVVFDVAGCRYMLYNGNDYGRTGMGLAVLSS